MENFLIANTDTQRMFQSFKYEGVDITVLSDDACSLDKLLSEGKGSEYEFFLCHYSIYSNDIDGGNINDVYELLRKYSREKLPKHLILISTMSRLPKEPFEIYISSQDITKILLLSKTAEKFIDALKKEIVSRLR
ncbi:hypothetical protein K8R66_02920 [bacterium]|nr:hypothetical protein [bacterium]